MIKINLLPPGTRSAAGRAMLAGLPWKKIGIGTAGLLVLYTGWVTVASARQSGRAARLSLEWEVIQPERIKLEEHQAALQALQNREAVLSRMKAPEGQWAPRLNFLSDVVVADLWFSALVLSGSSSAEVQSMLPEELKALSLPGLTAPEQSSEQMDASGMPLAPDWKPRLVLVGSALVTGKGEGAPVSRFLEKLKSHPDFSKWFTGVELKDVWHRPVGSEEVSDFVILLYPTGFDG